MFLNILADNNKPNYAHVVSKTKTASKHVSYAGEILWIPRRMNSKSRQIVSAMVEVS